MPEVEEDLVDGLSVVETRDTLQVTRNFHCKDLEGDTPFEIFSSALMLTAGATNHTGSDIPQEGDPLTLADGRVVYCDGRSLDPWPPNDAGVKCTYSLRPPAELTEAEDEGFFGRAQISGGTTLEQIQTDYDATNRKLAEGSRTPFTATYSGSISQPRSGGKWHPRFPVLLPKSVINFTRIETTEPTGRSRLFTGMRNSGTFLGVAAKELLMLSVTFDSNDGGETWQVTYSIAYDPDEKFNPTAVFLDDELGRPPFDVTYANSGLVSAEVQDVADFDDLEIVV